MTEASAISWICRSWSHRATAFAAMFGGPVYLVGSAMTKPNPFDFDIRLVMQDYDLERMFGPDGIYEQNKVYTTRHLRIWTCNLKQSRRWSRDTGGRNVDFQIQSVKVFESHTGPRQRIDDFPDDLFGAGLGDP